MKIDMKEYNLESFKLKDLYTWEEIIDIIYDLEYQIETLQEETKILKHKYDEWDDYDNNEEEYKKYGY